MKEYEKYIKILIVIIIITMLSTPALVYLLTTHISMSNISTSNDWIGFWGGFMPSMFSVLVTLSVLKITTNQTRNIQEENKHLTLKIQEENKNSQEIETRIKFTERIASLIGEYCSDINLYYYGCRKNERIRQEIHGMKKKGRTYKFSAEEIEELKVLNSNLKKGEEIVNRSKSVAIYFTLKILLEDKSESKELIEALQYIHSNSCSDVWPVEFEKANENLLLQTTRFINNYKNVVNQKS
ncbi:hypothetical protein [Niameybacter massiliensis]|uniref:hypothetical protein n=1 Tax=Niameybacter massiliensis TaxID=1658108 RepID=UPI0006B40DBB|nr:hypothetical protein [Niameybacter massiliensis]